MSALPAVQIRMENSESPEELSTIRSVNEAAFAGPGEALLVDQLRAGGHALISLVAEAGLLIVGHILFSRMWINTATGLVSAVALAPVAVLPDYQRQGIGSQLISRGVELLRDRNEQIVIVLGHHDYYPRFGFSTEKATPLTSPFPPEAFMAMELSPGALDGIEGPVVYPPPFGL